MRTALVILLGPTGVGKTDLSLHLAEHYHCPIISADSRQLYKDLPIGTDAPDTDHTRKVKHYMVGILEIADYYSAGQFENESLALLKQLHTTHPVVLMSGGSALYIEAVCKGISVPPIPDNVRQEIDNLYKSEGLPPLLAELKICDPIYYEEVDHKNPQRVTHALEIIRTTGKPYSFFRTHAQKPRPFQIIKIGLNRNKDELHARIDQRVQAMMKKGLLEEVWRVYPYKRLNALNTVGYKELFQFLDGLCTLDEAIEKIKQHTRNYARKQMMWFKQDKDIQWFHPDQERDIIAYIDKQLS